MQRRISLGAIAIAGVSLALVVGIAPAVGKTGRRSRAADTLAVGCNFTLTTVPPQGSTSVVAPASSGQQYGGLSCPQSGFEGGAIADTFQVPDSGDTVGVYVQYFGRGTVRGDFDLTPQEGTFGGGGTFQSQSWTGKISVTSGTGAYRGITSSGMGTMDCNSPDSVHLSCVEQITVNMPTQNSAGH